MTDKKYRLVTRADFDGVVSGSLLLELGLINEVMFAEPKEMQDGKVAITGNDITANLPFVEGVHLCFDHHLSETERMDHRANHIIEANAPSAARVIYNHYGAKEAFPEISVELMDAVDMADSAQYAEDQILAPDPWTLLNFILDPRTGLKAFEHFTVSHDQLMKDMMVYCRHHPVAEILTIPDVEERVHLYLEHEEKFELQLTRCTTEFNKTVVIDLRDETTIFAGNRFTIYAINPQCNVSVQVTHTKDGRTMLAVGKSIIDRSSTVAVGPLMLEYGGGGHAAAGSCIVENADADRVIKEVVERLNG